MPPHTLRQTLGEPFEGNMLNAAHALVRAGGNTMGLIGGTVRTIIIGALIGTVGYRIGNSRGYDAGMEEGKIVQRERDTLIARYEKAESARKLEGIAREAYERLRDQIHNEAEQPIDFSDTRYDALRKINREP